MPHLQRLFLEYEKRGLEFLAVNFGDKAETVAAYFSKEKFRITPALQKKDEASRAFGVRVYPTTYLIGTEGAVLWRAAGFDEPSLRSALERAMPGK